MKRKYIMTIEEEINKKIIKNSNLLEEDNKKLNYLLNLINKLNDNINNFKKQSFIFSILYVSQKLYKY